MEQLVFFKALLGHRFGTKTLHSKISFEDYNKIHLKCINDDRKLLNEFYELDKNFTSEKFYLLKTAKETRYEVFFFSLLIGLYFYYPIGIIKKRVKQC
jgi:hypothetical protein